MKPLLECQKCPALRAQFKRLRVQYPEYWNRPVPAHGPEDSPLLIVGLAPGLRGANRTGVPFVGDASGAMLTKVLKRLNALDQVRITNAVKCLPRNNKPSGLEVKRCRPTLRLICSNQLNGDWINRLKRQSGAIRLLRVLWGSHDIRCISRWVGWLTMRW